MNNELEIANPNITQAWLGLRPFHKKTTAETVVLHLSGFPLVIV